MFIYAFTMLFGLGIAYMFFTRMRLRKQKEVAAYQIEMNKAMAMFVPCLLYTSPSPRDQRGARMSSSP